MTADEFLAAELRKTEDALGTPILNRGRWDALCENRRMLVFLQERARGVDFQGVRQELQSIAAGYRKVSQVTGPRRRAEDCLRQWGDALEALDGTPSPTPTPTPT